MLYLLLALVGLQMLDLERPRLPSPNMWGFGVAQPYLALAAATYPAYTAQSLVVRRAALGRLLDGRLHRRRRGPRSAAPRPST